MKRSLNALQVLVAIGFIGIGVLHYCAKENTSSGNRIGEDSFQQVADNESRGDSIGESLDADSARSLDTDSQGGDSATTARAVEHIGEEVSMDKLRTLRISQPSVALRIALYEEQRSLEEGNDDRAAECAWIAIRAMTDLRSLDNAREKTRDMMELYPSSSWTFDVRRHLLSHPME